MNIVCIGAGILVTFCSPYVVALASQSHALDLRHLFSSVVVRSAERPKFVPEVPRGQFTDLTYVALTAATNHTHGEAAADRSSASMFADRLGASLGCTPFFYQYSRADERHHRVGNRSYHWVKDLTATPCALKPTCDALLVLIDVDYYIDMPKLLVDNFLPTLIYTFQPEAVTRVASNYSYTFNQLDEVVYNVTGGATYCHLVWKYSVDNLTVSRTLFGIPYATSTYLVDRKKTSSDHELILLTPVARWMGLSACLASLLQGSPLNRLKVVDGKFLRMEVHTTEGVFRSTALVGGYAHGYVSAANDDAIAAIARTSKLDLTLPQVQSFVPGERSDALPLLEYHRAQVSSKPDVVYPLASAVHRYQFTTTEYAPDAKPMLQAFMSPIIHGAYAPDLTEVNEARCVKARIKDVRANVPTTPKLTKIMLAFVEQFAPVAGFLAPVDEDELYDRQNRPTQRRILEEAAFSLPDRVVKMFMKKEAYPEPKDPRPISTINGSDKAAYSKYTYALSEYIKTMDWYAFGKSPKLIAERVTKVLANAQTAVNTDLSRFDGRVSECLRDLERMILVRVFHPAYHQELLTLHRSQFNLPAIGSLGTKYETGTARASGSPETAAFNSLANAFMAYLALWNNSSSPAECYSRLGIYGGDDGLTADVDTEVYVRACASVGQKLTVEQIKRGGFGIKFLARIYGPYVWFGDANSCCDLPRQLSKLHVTIVLPPGVRPEHKLVEKMRAFSLSDLATPIMGPLARRTMQLCNPAEAPNPAVALIRSFNADIPFDVQYPNEPAEWMIGYLDEVLPQFDARRFYEWLYGVSYLHELLEPPLCQEIQHGQVTVPLVLNGDIVHPPKETGKSVKWLPKKKAALAGGSDPTKKVPRRRRK